MEMEHLPFIPIKSKDVFFSELALKESEFSILGLLIEGKVKAVLLYAKRSEELCDLYVPTFGYGFTDIKHMSLLFLHLLAKEVTGTTNVTCMCYCHDEDMSRYLSKTNFGISMTWCVCKISPIENYNPSIQIRKLSKQEIHHRWKEVWNLLRCLVEHLRESPIFWFGDTFSEQFFYQFMMEEDKSLFVAEDKGKLIGLIDSNADQEAFIFKEEAYNISEAYLDPSYRRKGIIEALLKAAEEDLLKKGITYAWVNHGTCNPNANAFWDRYFTPYTYKFERTIYFKKGVCRE